MTARRLVPLAALCALLLGFGCTAPVEVPSDLTTARTEEKAEGWGLPVAPSPRAKKTTAELLVGTWQTVELDGEPVVKGCVYRFTFDPDGQFTTFADESAVRQDRGPQARSGTYSVNGRDISINFVRVDGEWVAGVAAITDISDSRLAIAERFETKKHGTLATTRILVRYPIK